MGFLDVILGSSKLPPAKLDRLFSLSTAAVDLESKMGLAPAGAAGVCIKPVESYHFEAVRQEIADLLKISYKDTGTVFAIEKDEYGYPWITLIDPDIDDLTTNVHMVAQTLMESGYGDRLLCAVFAFKGERHVYWIYSFKGGNFYPFVPLTNVERDNSLEFRLRTLFEGELTMEKDVEKWYPLWGVDKLLFKSR